MVKIRFETHDLNKSSQFLVQKANVLMDFKQINGELSSEHAAM